MAQQTQDQQDKLHFVLSLFITVLFALILLAYVIVHVLLIRRLKKFYPNFYQREKRKIMISLLSIITSLTCRIVINAIMMFDFNDLLNESFENGTWLFPIHQFIICTFGFVTPIGSITYSLMYGLSHRERMQKKQYNQLSPNKTLGGGTNYNASQSLIDIEDDLSSLWGGGYNQLSGESKEQIAIYAHNNMQEFMNQQSADSYNMVVNNSSSQNNTNLRLVYPPSFNMKNSYKPSQYKQSQLNLVDSNRSNIFDIGRSRLLQNLSSSKFGDNKSPQRTFMSSSNNQGDQSQNNVNLLDQSDIEKENSKSFITSSESQSRND
eukprot:403339976